MLDTESSNGILVLLFLHKAGPRSHCSCRSKTAATLGCSLWLCCFSPVSNKMRECNSAVMQCVMQCVAQCVMHARPASLTMKHIAIGAAAFESSCSKAQPVLQLLSMQSLSDCCLAMPYGHTPFIASTACSVTGQEVKYASERNADLQMLTSNDTDAMHSYTSTVVCTPSYSMLATPMQANGFE